MLYVTNFATLSIFSEAESVQVHRYTLLQRQNTKSYIQFSKDRKEKYNFFFLNKYETTQVNCVIMLGSNRLYTWKALG